MNCIIRTGYKMVLTAALAAGVIGSAMAAPANPYISTAISAVGGYSDSITATVTQIGSSYHYEYLLAFTGTATNPVNGKKAPLTTFSVGNLSNLAFLNAGNDANMVNPIYNPTSGNSVVWTSSTGVAVGQTIRFWYDSVNPYEEVDLTLQGGLSAYGLTLGMSAVPEPGVLASLGFGLASMGGMLLKRRSAK